MEKKPEFCARICLYEHDILVLLPVSEGLVFPHFSRYCVKSVHVQQADDIVIALILFSLGELQKMIYI